MTKFEDTEAKDKIDCNKQFGSFKFFHIITIFVESSGTEISSLIVLISLYKLVNVYLSVSEIKVKNYKI